MRIGFALTSDGAAGVTIADREIVDVSQARPGLSVGAQTEQMLTELLGSGAGIDPSGLWITADVSGILAPDLGAAYTVVRLVPRPPIDEDLDHSSQHRDFSATVVHAPGGHTILGDDLVRFDAEAVARIAKAAEPGERFVVSSVGSLINPAHELRAGEILLEHCEAASVEYAHRFFAGSLTVREHTALVNSSLLDQADAIGTALALAVRNAAPLARVAITTNDGGSTPVASLSVSPVHSLYAGAASELIGAAALCGLGDGPVVVAGRGPAFFGELESGVPSVVPAFRGERGARLATQSANLRPVPGVGLGLTGGQIDGPPSDGPPVVSHGAASVDGARLHYPDDLRALGAACTPLADWVNRMVNVNNAAEMDQALTVARSRSSARLVSFGAHPSRVRVLESRVIATAYQHPRVVSVRVRAVSGESTETILTGGDDDAADGR